MIGPNKRQIGQYYEERACVFLRGQGLELVAKNISTRMGELDLIMRDGVFLVFVEVRYRKNALFGDAASTVTSKKMQKIKKSAIHWMMEKRMNIHEVAYRFDVFAITGDEQEWIRNAF